jgi:hypothetical protein
MSGLGFRSVVAGYRLDGGDNLFLGYFVAGSDKAGVAPIHEDGSILFGVAAQGSQKPSSFRLVQGSKSHGSPPFFMG